MSEIIQRALIVQNPWASLIVGGRKKWELRKRACHIRGRVGIIEAGSGFIIGEADLVDCINLSSPQVGDDLQRWRSLHMVSPSEMEKYTVNFAWCFENAQRYKQPRAYEHKKGAQIWVELPDYTASWALPA